MDKVFAWAQRATPRPAFTSAANGAQYRVVVVPALSDNYQFLVINNASSEAVAVDCCDAPSILHQLQTERAILVAVLTTHFHADHSGGNEALAASQPGLAIFAGAADARRTPSCTNVIDDGDAVQLAGLRFKAMHTPGHTKGHTCFFLDDGVAQSVFTGDCIFVCGCGRFFEGAWKILRRCDPPRNARGRRPRLARDDVGLAREARLAAGGDARLLRARVYGGELTVRCIARPGRRRTAGQARRSRGAAQGWPCHGTLDDRRRAAVQPVPPHLGRGHRTVARLRRRVAAHGGTSDHAPQEGHLHAPRLPHHLRPRPQSLRRRQGGPVIGACASPAQTRTPDCARWRVRRQGRGHEWPDQTRGTVRRPAPVPQGHAREDA